MTLCTMEKCPNSSSFLGFDVNGCGRVHLMLPANSDLEICVPSDFLSTVNMFLSLEIHPFITVYVWGADHVLLKQVNR